MVNVEREFLGQTIKKLLVVRDIRVVVDDEETVWNPLRVLSHHVDEGILIHFPGKVFPVFFQVVSVIRIE